MDFFVIDPSAGRYVIPLVGGGRDPGSFVRDFEQWDESRNALEWKWPLERANQNLLGNLKSEIRGSF